MCYSALVEQNSKTLGLAFKARIDHEAFADLFNNRLRGSGAKIPKALENAFLENPVSSEEKRIAELILGWREVEGRQLEQDLFAQSKRLADAERTLLTKITKKAQNDQRIASDKIAKLKSRIVRLKSDDLVESDSRIFPGQYAPLVIEEDRSRMVRPFRYHLRPKGQSPDFDRRFDGCYNARRDSLAEVFWWKSVYGRRHGIMVIKSFWENVNRHDFEKRQLRQGEKPENVVLRFDPKGLDRMIVPCLFDHNEEGEFPLDSFALITDDPNPEVAAVGHNRTPIIMKPEYVDLWLRTRSNDLATYGRVFDDKQPTYFEHSVAA